MKTNSNEINLVGYSLGKYEIHAEIGRGGMGVVYKGYDPLLERFLAVKVLAPHLVWEKEFVHRFLREARAAARLKHPNIVTIYDVGQHEGWYYFVMEYVEGVALDAFVHQHGLLPLCDVMAVTAAMASALDYAHSNDLIHRDIKPGNIIVCTSGQIVLTDFGIARAAHEQRMTSTGTILGTPEYMSPEQAKSEPIDARSDLYSLAMVSYQLLSGVSPYAADSILSMLYKVVNEPLPPIRTLRPDLPEAVEAVLQKALEKDPEHRYTNVTDFFEALYTALGARATEGPSLIGQGTEIPPALMGAGVVTPLPGQPVTPPPQQRPPTPLPQRPVTPSPQRAVTPPQQRPPTPLPQRPMTPSPQRPLTLPPAVTVVETEPPPDESARRRIPVWAWGILAALVLVGIGVGGGIASGIIGGTPTPTAMLAPTATNTPTATLAAAHTATATATPTATASPTPAKTPTRTPTPSRTPESAETETPTPTPTLTPSVTPTRAPAVTSTPTVVPPTATPRPTDPPPPPPTEPPPPPPTQPPPPPPTEPPPPPPTEAAPPPTEAPPPPTAVPPPPPP